VSSAYVQIRSVKIGSEGSSGIPQAFQVKEVIGTAPVDVFISAVISFAAGVSVGVFMMYVPFFAKFNHMQNVLKQINEYFIADAKKHANEP
jgi:hypothetical protein